MTVFRSKLLITILLFIAIGILPENAQALTISPARFEIETDPGTEVKGEILLTNEQSEAKTFYSSFENFEANGDTGTPNFVPGDSGLASWISSEPSVTLNPGEEKTILFTINVPQGVSPGGYFAAVFWGTSPVQSSSGDISVGARIGMLVLLRVSGEVIEEGGISDMGTESGEVLFDSLPINLTYTFNNAGGDRLNPKGTVDIRNILGMKIESLNANISDGNVLPQSSRKYKIAWGKPLDKKGFLNKAFYQLKHFAIGPYKVTANVTYGVKNVSDKESFTVWFLPWQLSMIILLLLLISWIIFVRIVKTRRKLIRRQRELEAKILQLEKMAKHQSQTPSGNVNSSQKNLPPKKLSEIKNFHTMKK